MMDEFIHWPKPYLLCHQLVMKYCNGRLKFDEKSIGK